MLISCGDASELFEFVKEPFDEIAVFVDVSVVAVVSGSAAVHRDHNLGALSLDSLAEVICVVGFVGQDMLGGKALDQSMGLSDVVTFSACEDETNRIAQGIDRDMQLGCQTAFAPANGSIFRPPFLPAAC